MEAPGRGVGRGEDRLRVLHQRGAVGDASAVRRRRCTWRHREVHPRLQGLLGRTLRVARVPTVAKEPPGLEIKFVRVLGRRRLGKTWKT